MRQAEQIRTGSTTRTRTRTRTSRAICGRLGDPTTFAPDGPPGVFVAAPGRFHLFADRTSAAAHRSTLVIALAGLGDVITVSTVDDAAGALGSADALGSPGSRGERRLAPVPLHRNRLPGLEEAYRATDAQFTGPATVPALWDRDTYRVVSNDYPTLERDLATEFAGWSATGVQLYPRERRAEIDELDRWLGPVVDQGPSRLRIGSDRNGDRARALLNEAFARLDRTLSNSRYLLGEQLTLADVRLWVTLVRFGADAGRPGRISAELQRFASLWAYAQNLYEREEFRATTDAEALRRPSFGV
ncbi:glutathionyl-hydroquinone reductase YqjG [Kineosporia mesophila]|uniref:Glutathionyl-hydroquinone reductase YqjG n=1 Tax=Kineosporia mesophila TaxID=566012 RepID=A0ABP7APK5_9ACTN|nr:glutathione S-transferase C-terminal domain-containing protein [Kineosporia mesophila]MCD5349342.1 glutathione S-transferase C-terminal domain-containing protein [Kineosporia mesophila]